VTAAAAVDEYGAVERCVEAPFLVSGKLSRQHARTTEKMDLRYADPELSSHLLAGEEAAVAQSIEATLESIAQASCAASAHDFECFAIVNPDLMDKSALARCYRPERLALDAARRTFILPDLAR
jgi:hypothetical protein